MARWGKGERTVQYLVDRARLESFEARNLGELGHALIGRAARRVETTAVAALAGGDVDGAYVAAYDAYRMAAESLLARQGLRAAGGDGSHMAVEDLSQRSLLRRFRSSRSRRSSVSGGPALGPVLRPRCRAHRRGGCVVGNRESDGGRVRREVPAGDTRIARAV